MEVANAMEKEEANKPKGRGDLDEDQAMAAFAENLNTELSDQDIKTQAEKEYQKQQAE